MKLFTELTEPALVWTGRVMLEGRVAIPPKALAAVIFASSPGLADEHRDERVVAELYDRHVATMYVPLLTDDELQFDSHTTHFRFDAEFLGQRFVDVALWMRRNRATAGLPVGYLGSSGGAAGALVAAALRPDLTSVIVAIDARTDLAVEHLRAIKVPTLLLVKDMPVLRMNREALPNLRGERRIEIVHGTDVHAVELVTEKAVHWLEDKLALVPADAFGIV